MHRELKSLAGMTGSEVVLQCATSRSGWEHAGPNEPKSQFGLGATLAEALVLLLPRNDLGELLGVQLALLELLEDILDDAAARQLLVFPTCHSFCSLATAEGGVPFGDSLPSKFAKPLLLRGQLQLQPHVVVILDDEHFTEHRP